MNIVYFGDAANEFSNRHYLALKRACGASEPPAAVRGQGHVGHVREPAVRRAGPSCRVVAVVDSPRSGWVSTRQGGQEGSAPFALAAGEAGIPVLRPDEPNSPAVVAGLAALEPDLFVAVGYTRRLSPSLLALPRLGAVNFHASLLPAYRGKHPVFWALHFGERTAGLTVHRMDARIDAGEILYQVRVRTRLDDSVAGLYERVMDRSVGLMPRLVRDARRGTLAGRSQDERAGSYFSSTTPEDFRLGFDMPAELFARRAAATPGRCWFSLHGRPVRVVEAALEARRAREAEGWDRGRAPSAGAGRLQSLGRCHALVAAGPGTVRLRRLAWEDGPDLPAAALLREAGLERGGRLEE